MTPNGQTTANSVLPPITQNSPSIVTKDHINEMTPNGQATAISVLPPKTQNSSSVTKDNINEKPSQSSKRAKNDPTYVVPLILVISSCSNLLSKQYSLGMGLGYETTSNFFFFS